MPIELSSSKSSEKTEIVLSLLIPIYNEERNIESVLQRLSEVPWNYGVELIFVDDCSTDNSVATLTGWIAQHQEELIQNKMNILFIQHPTNLGKGAGIQTAIAKACGQVLLVQDADEEYVPSEIPSLVAPILENKADVVYGSRFRQNVAQAHRTYHYLINRFLTTLSNLCSGLYVTDMETCYKAFRSEVLKGIRLRSQRFGFEPEITAHIAHMKLRVWELPISYYPRTYLQGKKITWKDGFAALWHIAYFNWMISNTTRFHPSLPAKYLPLAKNPSSTASGLA